MAGIGTIVAMIKALGNKTDQEIAQIEEDVTDVKTAIQGKMDEPETAGTAGQVLGLDNSLNPVWLNSSADPSAIASAVDSWLEGNITNPSNPPIDRNLALANAAAPADMAGNMKDEITLFTGNKRYTEWTKNKWIKYTAPQTQVNETGWESILVPCKPGDIFYVKGYGGSSPRLWCFSDSQGSAVYYSGVVTTNEYILIVAPANSAYLACNSKYSEIKGDLIVGKTLSDRFAELKSAFETNGFNQIVPDGNFETAKGWLGNGSPSWTLSAEDNILTAAVNSNKMKLQRDTDWAEINIGHKYFANVEYYGSDFSRVAIAVGSQTQIGDTTANTWNKIATVISVTSKNGNRSDCQVEIDLANNYTVQNIKIKNFWVVDLTDMYGAGNEPTAAEFVLKYSEDYYAQQTIKRDISVTEYVIQKYLDQLGTAAQKNYTTTVSSGSNDLPTAGAVNEAILEAVTDNQSGGQFGISRDAYLIKEEIPSQYTEHNATPVSFDDDEYLEKKLATVPVGKKFLYFTDVHWPSNEKKTIPLVNYVRKRLGIPKVLFGGDVLNRSDTGYIAKYVYTSFMYQAKSAFGCDFIPAIGNHETNESNMQGSSHTDIERAAHLLPFSQIQPIQGSDLLDYVHTEYDMVKDDLSDYATGDNLDELKAYFKTIFYFDDPVNKTRYIVLNTGNPGSLNDAGGLGVISDVFDFGWTGELRLQFDWFASVLSTTQNGYDVVVLGHQFANENADLDMPKYPQIIMQMCRGAIQKQSITVTPPQLSNTYANMIAWYSNSNHVYDFTEIQQIKSIIMVCGHAHYDGISINGYNGNNEYVSTVYNGETLDQIEDGVIPLIVTTTDAYQSWDVSVSGATKVPMEYGTTTDHAFDVMTYVDDGIDIKRFGAGNNRKIYIDYPSQS